MTAPDDRTGRGLERWELVAREAVRHTLTSYHFAGDRGRLDELADCFQPDGTLEVVGTEPWHGRAAIRDGLAQRLPDRRRDPVEPVEPVSSDVQVEQMPSPPPGYIRHHLASPHFRLVTPTEIRTSTYFAALTDIGLDHWGRYADVLTPEADGDRWLLWHRAVTVEGHAPDSHFRR